MTETKYTLDQFESDMENATPDQMEMFLMKAVDELDIFDTSVKESLQKYKEELQDIKSQMDIEEDKKCNKDIESGKVTLFTCIKEVPGSTYKVGEGYYADIENLSEFLSKPIATAVSGMSEEVSNYINNRKPLIWIIKDKGIGTLKKRNIFGLSQAAKGIDLNFSEYFEKVSK